MLDIEETCSECGYRRISDSLFPSYLTTIPSVVHARLGGWEKLATPPGGAHALCTAPGQSGQWG